MNWLKGLISDGEGHPSSMRVFLLLFGAVVMGAWLYHVITQTWVSPPWEAAGVLAGGKALQSFGERE